MTKISHKGRFALPARGDSELPRRAEISSRSTEEPPMGTGLRTAVQIRAQPADPIGSTTHPLLPDSWVQACRIFIPRRPLFFRARIAAPVPHIADFYTGFAEGDEEHLIYFFAHPGDFQTHQAVAALLLQLRATLQPELYYPLRTDWPRR